MNKKSFFYLSEYDNLDRPLYQLKIDVESLKFDIYMIKQELRQIIIPFNNTDNCVENVLENLETFQNRRDYLDICQEKLKVLEEEVLNRTINGED